MKMSKKPAKKRKAAEQTPFHALDSSFDLDKMTSDIFETYSEQALRAFLGIRKWRTDGTHAQLASRAMVAWENNAAVDSSEEHALRANLREYKETLVLGPDNILPDPFTLKNWVDEKSKHFWPSVYFKDICDLLDKTQPSELCKRIINCYKEQKAFRYFSEGAVKEVFYHNVSDTSDVAFLSAKVLPSMKKGHYECWVAVVKDSLNKPGGQILASYCTCVAGMKGSCNHVAGLLFRVEFATRAGLTKPSCTSVPCMWKDPGQSSEQDGGPPTKFVDLEWTTESYLHEGDALRDRTTMEDAGFSPTSARQTQYMSDTDKVRGEMADLLAEHAPQSAFLQLYRNKPFPRKPTLACPEPPIVIAKNLNGGTVDDLLEAMKKSDEERDNLCRSSVDQGESLLWHDHRKGIVTASNYRRVYTRMATVQSKPDTDVSALVHNLMGYREVRETYAIKHGKSMEFKAKKKLEKIMKNLHKKFKGQNCSLIIDKQSPCLGASPDLLISCSCCGEGVCEIKCPESIKHTKPAADNYKYIQSGKLGTKTSHYAQIQGQMALTGRLYGFYFVYTTHGYHLEKIQFDADYWCDLKASLIAFWSNFVAPEMITGNLYYNTTNADDITPSDDHSYFASSQSADATTPARKPIFKNTGPLTKPRLPAIFLCGKCGEFIYDHPKNKGEESVQCCECLMWFHIRCTCLRDVEQVNGTDWFCMNC